MADVSADHQRTSLHRIRLVIADPQPIVQNGLRSVFAAQHDFEIVVSCSHGKSCLEAIRKLAPDIALLGSSLPDLTGNELLAIAKAENLPTRLVFFTDPEGDDDLTAAIAAGACGAISKYANPDTILRSLRLMTECFRAPPETLPDLSQNGKEVRKDDGAKIEKILTVLTDRERQIMRLVSEGLSNKEIARELNLSQGTVKVHLYNMFQKLEISNRTVLAKIALLERSAGVGTLSLAALALAISSDAKASDTNDTSLDDDSTAPKDPEHSGFELWNKEILRHILFVESGGTIAASEKDLSITPIQVTPRRREWKSCVRPSRPCPPAYREATARLDQARPIWPFRRRCNRSTMTRSAALRRSSSFAAGVCLEKSGGHSTFAVTARGLIYALDNSHAAAQARDLGETLTDTSTVAIADGTPQVATITIHDGGNLASVVPRFSFAARARDRTMASHEKETRAK